MSTTQTAAARRCPYCDRVTHRGVFLDGTNGHREDCPRFIVHVTR